MSPLVIFPPKLLAAQLRLDIIQRLEQHAAVLILGQRMPQLAGVQQSQLLQCVTAATTE